MRNIFKDKGTKLMSIYLEIPITLDILFITAFYFIHRKAIPFFELKVGDNASQVSIISYLISSAVSLAGFILAALTIIVTFKSNLKSKSSDIETPLDYIFSKKYYSQIVDIFKSAITEFSLCFVLLFIFWAIAENLSSITLNFVVFASIISILLTTYRSLNVLFKILTLDKSQT